MAKIKRNSKIPHRKKQSFDHKHTVWHQIHWYIFQQLLIFISHSEKFTYSSVLAYKQCERIAFGYNIKYFAKRAERRRNQRCAIFAHGLLPITKYHLNERIATDFLVLLLFCLFIFDAIPVSDLNDLNGGTAMFVHSECVWLTKSGASNLRCLQHSFLPSEKIKVLNDWENVKLNDQDIVLFKIILLNGPFQLKKATNKFRSLHIVTLITQKPFRKQTAKLIFKLSLAKGNCNFYRFILLDDKIKISVYI